MRSRQLPWIAGLVLGCAVAADGQGQKPRVAGIAPAPAPAPQHPPAQDHGSYYYHQSGRGYGTVPVIIDGGYVYADFGYGYERVLRSCAATYGSGWVQTGHTPPAYTPPTYTPPTYTPPSYSATPSTTGTPSAPARPAPDRQSNAGTDRSAGRTAGIAPIPPQPPAQQPSYGRGPACWVTDAYGRIYVVRP